MTTIKLTNDQSDEVVVQVLKDVFKSHLLERDEGGELIDEIEMIESAKYLLHHFMLDEDATKFVQQCWNLRKAAESVRAEQRKKSYRDTAGLSGSS